VSIACREILFCNKDEKNKPNEDLIAKIYNCKINGRSKVQFSKRLQKKTNKCCINNVGGKDIV